MAGNKIDLTLITWMDVITLQQKPIKAGNVKKRNDLEFQLDFERLEIELDSTRITVLRLSLCGHPP